MARRSSSDGGCAWFLLLVIISCVIWHFYGAGFAFMVFCMVIFFAAMT